MLGRGGDFNHYIEVSSLTCAHSFPLLFHEGRLKGGTQRFPKHEVSDNKKLVRRRFAVYGIFNSSTVDKLKMP